MNIRDSNKLLLGLALVLGGMLRFMPPAVAGFPVNDGGMFYVMVEELKASHFLLPTFTQYNLAEIPFAYPPFGLYFTALVSTLFRFPALEVVRWLPPLVSTMSLLAFFLAADEILGSKTQASLATLFYGLTPASYGWAIMGGGITRSFGLSFLYLTIAFANRLFSRPSRRVAGGTVLFGALAVLSHPETGIQAAGACLLLWMFRGRSRQSLLRAGSVALGVAALTAPWWGTVLARHGLDPIQSALISSNDGTLSAWVELFTLQLGGGVFFSLTVALGLVGLLAKMSQRKMLLPVWLLLPFLLDPRSAGGIAMIPLSLLAGFAFDQVLAPGLLALRQKQKPWIADRFVFTSLLVIILYLFFGSSVFGMGLAGKSLSQPDREVIKWVREHLPPEGDFLLLTGEPYSMKDPLQEWFPALSPQHSQTTLQGLEWTLGVDFFPHYGDLVTLQYCADVACVESWAQHTDLAYQYLLIRVPPESGTSVINETLGLLLESAARSKRYERVYQADHAVIFKFTGKE